MSSMDPYEFLEATASVAKRIVKYNVSDSVNMKIAPHVEKGFLRQAIKTTIPDDGDHMKDIIKETFDKIIPYIVHYNHQNFASFTPAPNAYPSVLGDMLCVAMGGVGFSWESCPSLTELELFMANWVSGILNIPRDFMNSVTGGQGGGCHQQTDSDALYNVYLAARHRLLEARNLLASDERYTLMSKFCIYASEDAHISVFRLATVEHLTLRLVPCDKTGRCLGSKLKEMILDDLKDDKIPLMAIATLGGFVRFGIDNLMDFSACRKDFPNLWIHADCSFGACAMMLPTKYPDMVKNLNQADSIVASFCNFSPASFDCTFMWLKNIQKYLEVFVVNPAYLKHHLPGAVDLRHYGIALSRRFRGFKDFLTLRIYGVSGLTSYISDKINIANAFAGQIRKMPKIEVVLKKYTIVHFRLRNMSDEKTRQFYEKLKANYDNLLFFPIKVDGRFMIRFTPSSSNMTVATLNPIIVMIKNSIPKK